MPPRPRRPSSRHSRTPSIRSPDLVADLEQKNAAAQSLDDPTEQDNAYRDSVIPAMDALRVSVDEMEKVCGHDYWPVPSYNKILFYV